MARVRSKGTKIELIVRKTLSAFGVRYRLHRRDLPGTPDLFVARLRLAIFVNGCWWHGHPCRLGGREARSNVDYWRKKIARNAKRDAETRAALHARGLRRIDLWECEKSQFHAVCKAVAAEYLDARRLV